VEVVFHALDEAGDMLASQAVESYHEMLASASSVSQLLELIHQQRFRWGVSDGN
jgi:hypothetical protein